jgi:Protein of unknown function (DUF3826)
VDTPPLSGKMRLAMKKEICTLALLLSAMVFARFNSTAQDTDAVYSTPPASKAELEAIYTQAIEIRTEGILATLGLADAVKSNRVHDIIMAQYRALRARDEGIDAKLKAEGKAINYADRAPQLLTLSKPLHQEFLARLAACLTPEQIQKVKDKMTYNKVEVTYNAYCAIVPDLTDADKAKIMELLKAAREEAMDGGNAPEKSAIFQKYKDQINDYLNARGHDVAQAYRVWNAKHPEEANTNAPQTASPK